MHILNKIKNVKIFHLFDVGYWICLTKNGILVTKGNGEFEMKCGGCYEAREIEKG